MFAVFGATSGAVLWFMWQIRAGPGGWFFFWVILGAMLGAVSAWRRRGPKAE